MYQDFLAERIAKLRLSMGVSARDMSLTLGQADNYINHIENKKSLPSITSFFYICEYFNITPMEFFDEDNNNPEQLKQNAALFKEYPPRENSNTDSSPKKNPIMQNIRQVALETFKDVDYSLIMKVLSRPKT